MYSIQNTAVSRLTKISEIEKYNITVAVVLEKIIHLKRKHFKTAAI